MWSISAEEECESTGMVSIYKSEITFSIYGKNKEDRVLAMVRRFECFTFIVLVNTGGVEKQLLYNFWAKVANYEC